MKKLTIAITFMALLGSLNTMSFADPCDPNIIAATIEINPQTINLKSKGNWITCHIQLPEDNNVADIDAESIFLEGQVEAEWKWFEIEDQVLMVKFDRSDVQALLEPGDAVELTVSGELADGNEFEGTDIVKVIGPMTPPFAIAKLRVRNRRTIGQDSIKISGTIDVNAFDIVGADSIHVGIWSASVTKDPNYYETINFSPNEVKKDKYKYRHQVRRNESGAITSLKLDLHRHKFSLEAKNLDLSALVDPLTLEIEVGAYHQTTNWP